MPCFLADIIMVDLLSEYQTFIVGLLGFIGVVITMIVNAKIQRNLQIRQRQHEAESVRTALLVELRANVKIYKDHIEDFSRLDGDHAIVPRKVVNKVYQTLLPSIGLLSVEEVELVHVAYLSLEELPYRLSILVGSDSVDRLSEEYIRIDAAQVQVAAGIHEALLPSIRKALSVLERNA